MHRFVLGLFALLCLALAGCAMSTLAPDDSGAGDGGVDASMADGGRIDVDGGPIDVDAGPIDVDAGPIDVDAGPIDVDASVDWCGNGKLDPGEGCDDANRVAGDGCDASCQLESRCSIATTVTPGTPETGTTIGAPDIYTSPCSDDGMSGEAAFRVDVTGAFDLIATATPTDFATDGLDIVLTATTDCADAAATIDCTDGPRAADPETITILDAAGTYYFVLDGYAGTAGAWEFDVQLRAVVAAGGACDPTGTTSRCETGLACGGLAGAETCFDPTTVACTGATSASLTAPNTGTLAPGSSDLAPTCAFDAGTDEALYFVDLASRGFLTVAETGMLTMGSIYALGPGGCLPSLSVGCDTGGVRSFVTGPLAAGRYRVVVDGTGAYSLDVRLGSYIAAGGTCDLFGRTAICDAGTYCLGRTCSALAETTDTAPNANFCDAQGPFAGDFVVNGDITGGTDIDTFELTLTAPHVVSIETSNGAGGCEVNTVLEVFDAAGMTCATLDAAPPTPIAMDDNSGRAGICSQLVTASLPAGTYYVRVRRAPGSATTGTYVLVADVE